MNGMFALASRAFEIFGINLVKNSFHLNVCYKITLQKPTITVIAPTDNIPILLNPAPPLHSPPA
jgi:hypothetical protein